MNKDTRRKPRRVSVAQEVETLRTLPVRDLQDRYLALYGHESRSNNRGYLWKKLAWRIQELAERGLSDETRAKARELAEGTSLRTRVPRGFQPDANVPEPVHPKDPRLPAPGTVLRKEHGGQVHEITVLADGFEYCGQRYASLSRIAKLVTGTSWNGFYWLGLTQRKRKAGSHA